MTTPDRSTRLMDVTFCVLDLETTGTSDEVDDIVEVGAVLVRGGERLGTFQTMVRHPLFTGHSDLPSVGAVLASLLEFMRGAVVVGHNIRFDLRFLNAALWKTGHDAVLDPVEAIDTVPLARRLLRDDADDCRLGTLAKRFEFDEQPTHRALADAAATVELLHLLIERATHYGALDLDDLMQLPFLMRHRHRARLAATAQLPRAAGVACLLDRSDEVLHVVSGDDIRQGVRHLFHETSPVRPAVLQHLHRVAVVQTGSAVVAQLASLRWTSATQSRRPAAVYLQRVPARAARLRVVTSRDVAGVVAGPMQRPVARHAVSTLSAMSVSSPSCIDQFVDALHTDAPHLDAMAMDDPILIQAVEQQRAIARGRALTGRIDLDDCVVDLDDGRVVDIVTNGRSWADVLPPSIGDDRPDRPASVARAVEAAFVAQLLSGRRDYEIRDTWSPQY